MKIRLENNLDYIEVENLVRNSFWNVYRPGAYEHYLVHNLRDDKCFIENLAYVIECGDKIVGHINYSTGYIDYGDEQTGAVVLGPVSIDKDYQNNGLGTKLIQYTLNLAKDNNIPFVFVVGDENYYHRFGFESASDHNVFLDGTDINDECPFFMIKIFSRTNLKKEIGIFHNPDAFDVDEVELDEFDRQFEYKEKLVLDTQLKEL